MNDAFEFHCRVSSSHFSRLLPSSVVVFFPCRVLEGEPSDFFRFVSFRLKCVCLVFADAADDDDDDDDTSRRDRGRTTVGDAVSRRVNERTRHVRTRTLSVGRVFIHSFIHAHAFMIHSRIRARGSRGDATRRDGDDDDDDDDRNGSSEARVTMGGWIDIETQRKDRSVSSSTSTTEDDDDARGSAEPFSAQKWSSSSSSSSTPRDENDDESNDKCRFCRRRKPPPLSPSQRAATLPSSAPNDALVLVGCDCRDADLASAHKSCACRWFAPRARGVATGFALDPEWNLTWTCECEVCLAPLGASLLADVVDVCKRALRTSDAALLHHRRHHRRRRFSAPSVTGE